MIAMLICCYVFSFINSLTGQKHVALALFMCILNVGTIVTLCIALYITISNMYHADKDIEEGHNFVDYTVYGFTFVFMPVTCIMLRHNIRQAICNRRGEAYFFVMGFD